MNFAEMQSVLYNIRQSPFVDHVLIFFEENKGIRDAALADMRKLMSDCSAYGGKGGPAQQ
jgi:hypothetical protein